MAVVRTLGRFFSAAIFVLLGWEAAKEPGGRTQAAAALGVPQPELAVRANGLTMVLAGALFGLGLVPRWAALALAAALAPTTIAGHPFWKETDPQKRHGQYIHFLKNLSMIGALLMAAAEEPRPTLREHAQAEVQAKAHEAKNSVNRLASRLASAASF